MATRVEYKGMPATAGGCRGCDKVLIVTDKDANGNYMTFHGDPLCDWYNRMCAAAIPVKPEWVTFGEEIKSIKEGV